MLTPEGGWRLAGFGFAMALAGADGRNPAGAGVYAYSDPFPTLLEELSKVRPLSEAESCMARVWLLPHSP